jgi:hypothetical protein
LGNPESGLFGSEYESYPHGILPYFYGIYYNVLMFTGCALIALFVYISLFVIVFIYRFILVCDFVEKIANDNLVKVNHLAVAG